MSRSQQMIEKGVARREERLPVASTFPLAAPPPRARLVARERLYAALDAGLDVPLTLVHAPAGYGKTSLLAGWLAARRPLAAWVALDATVRDTLGFLRTLIAALQPHAPTLGTTTLALLDAFGPPRPDLLLSTLLTDLQALGTPIVLVLDDYQAIQAEAVHGALGWLVERMPPDLHIFILSRETPPLPLARMRAAGQLAELNADALRFTAAESAQFLNATMGLGLATEQVRELEARTDGWVGGLQLAALALREPNSRARVLAAFSGTHRFVADYFADQVFERMPPPLAAFVLQTAVLTRLSSALCDAVLGDAALPVPAGHAQATLEELERANLFLLPLDDQRNWYRYHPLFADMARERLRQRVAPDRIAALHLRASEWWQQHGDLDGAIDHALAAGAHERAADIIEARALDFMASASGLEGWLADLQPALWQMRPRLWLARAAGMIASANYAALVPCLQQAEATLAAAAAPDAERTRRDIAAFYAMLRTLADDPGAPALISGLLAELEVHHPLRAVLAAALTYATFGVGDTAGARHVATSELALLPPAPRALAERISLLALLALVDWGQGRLNDVELHCAEVLRLAQNGAQLVPVLGTGMTLLMRGVLLAERNDLQAAARDLSECAAVAGQAQIAPLVSTAQMYLALVLQAQGDHDAAHERFALADAALRSGALPPLTQKELEGCRALFWLRSGDLSSASRWAARYTATHTRLTPYDYPRIALARTLIAEGKAARAASMLAQLAAEAEDAGYRRFQIWALVLEALAHHAQNDTQRALAVLEHALLLGQPEGYTRLFADEGAPMAVLLRAAQGRNINTRYVTHILDAIAPAPSPADLLAEPLTPREREVLRLIAAGASNQAIAQQLVLTLGTVKKYANSIFGKLGVRSRTQAIVRGRELGLL